ncbi:MAG: rhodanese-like domain-containing protein [Thermoleophilia bacterium]|jgi:rhodanese-related sulfurtransferase|nr:rhodanese-like domain-containing protein [Thermoleophilia bacterium]
MTAHEDPPSPSGHDVPEKKQTVPGLYVTSREAYEMWKAAPEKVHIIDVRTPEEYVFVGHAAMARNIPLVFMRRQWDAEKDEPVVEPNAEFVPRVQALHAPGDTLLLICRSGGRSAWAVDFLARAGFTNAYNVIDGTEGDKVDDPGSAYHGKRMRNGWKNSGLTWTYDCDPSLLWTD